ncbi:putative 4-hydroxybenzoate polyprenyltransferase [archaeon]|nr:putative 4-hydroxybenzoate polyprenyltransferase [archaeon]
MPLISKIKILLEMIKIEHTVFAMPFLYSGAILAAGGIPSFHILTWITIGIISARTAAMGLNRLIDRDIDAKNPRTSNRALPAGLVSIGEVRALVGVSLVVLLIAAVMLNWLCIALYPFAVALFVVYPYLKRYTWLSHIVLGMTLGVAPLGAWAAVTGSLAIVPVLLFLAVTFWVAGFDIIYAYQDLEFDKSFGLHSIPKRFGMQGGLLMSSMFHGLMIILLLITMPLANLGMVFMAGVAVIAALLAYEHRIVKPDNLEKVGVAFFNINAVISVSFFVFIATDVLL